MRDKWCAVLVASLVMLAISLGAPKARAGSSIPVTATLTSSCESSAVPCKTDTPNSFSLTATQSFSPSSTVESEILTHNSVYTLNTMNTLVNGVVGNGTETVTMHFYSTVAGTQGDVLPACWGISNNDGNIVQAVNWSVFLPNSASFTKMAVNQSVTGHGRLDFNVRPQCDNQIYRFYLTWSNACITRTTSTTWVVTGDACGANKFYGTASLYGQGGKHGQTVYYGDWRLPYWLTLTEQ